MKKNFLKKLALAMALVVTATSVNVPAASAAATPGFKSEKVTVKVDQTKKYSTANSSKYSVKFKIGNTSVATIKYSKGSKAVKVTGVAEGKTTLRADFTSYATKKVTTQRIPVTVKAKAEETPVVTTAELASVKQTAANVFEATFTADARETVKVESFTKIESADGIYTTTVKSVEFSADGTVAKVETYGNFIDKTVFNVTCNEKTASFTASVGKVTTVVIATTQAQKGVETDIEFALYDANNIDVTSVIALNSNVFVDVTGDYASIDTAKSSDATITMDTVGDKATVTVTYDALDGSAEVKATQTITCVDSQAVAGATQYFTFGNEYGGALPKVYLNSYKPVTTIYVGDADSRGYFVAVDKKGNAIAYDEYEIESSNESVLTIAASNDTGKHAAFDVAAVAPGTAQVVIKATKNEKVYTYAKTVTVKAERKATSIKLSSSSVSLAKTADDNYSDGVSAFVLDQYNNIMYDATVTAEGTTDKANDALNIRPYGTAGHGWIDITTKDAATKDTYTVKVTGTDTNGVEVSKKFAVAVKLAPEETPTNVSYKLELSKKTIDLNPESICNFHGVNHLTTTVRLAKYVGGVFDSYVDNNDPEGVEVEVKKAGKIFTNDLSVAGSATGSAIGVDTAADTYGDADGANGGVTFTAVAAAKMGVAPASAVAINQVDDLAATGTYTVTVKYTADGKEAQKTTSFSVVNTLEMPTVNVSSTTVDTKAATAIIADCLTTDVSLLGDDGNESIKGLCKYNTLTKKPEAIDDDTDWTDADKLTIKYVEVEDTFWNVTYHYYVPVTRTFQYK